MKPLGPFDSDLEMYVDKPRDFNYPRIGFERYLAEGDRAEHPALGPVGGEIAFKLNLLTDESNERVKIPTAIDRIIDLYKNPKLCEDLDNLFESLGESLTEKGLRIDPPEKSRKKIRKAQKS